MAITREDYVEQSVQTYAKRQLFDVRGYPEEQIDWLDSFDDNMFTATHEPSKNYVASGFDFDDGGRAGELGSDLIRRLYTFEFFIIGLSSQWAKNLAQAIKFGIENDGVIPILDIADADAAPDWPQIDALILEDVTANRVMVQDPAPWQRHIWVTRCRVWDEYYARLT
jgi:hypothetical protein